MTAVAADILQLLGQAVYRCWKHGVADAEAEYSVNPAGNGTSIIPHGSQTDPAIGQDATTAGILAKPKHRRVARRQIKRSKKTLFAQLKGVFYFDIGGQFSNPPLHFATAAICTHDDAHIRSKSVAIVPQNVNYLKKVAVQGRFPAQ
jgi:hypothetical protein